MTITRSKRSAASAPHVLNFFFDDDDGCALTALVKDFRFHVFIDREQLRAVPAIGDVEHIADRYDTLLRAVRRRAEEEEYYGGGEASDTLRSETRTKASESSRGRSSPHDSAIDVRDPTERNSAADCSSSNGRSTSMEDDPEKALHDWILEPFIDIFEKLDLEPEDGEKQTLQDWYSGPTYFYELRIKNGSLDAIELEPTSELESRIEQLTPQIAMPKYIRSLDIPWFDAKDVVVTSESDEAAPWHPSRVRIGDEAYFFKVADPTQADPTKRELKLMTELERKGLHEQIRVPLVKGLVGFGGSKTHIIGFLQTDIQDPTPLTNMLDSDVVEEKRDNWAKEVERTVDILHKNDIIWGDAKADNFVVDRRGDLWIIDFGGSYTDGWVDPELMETEEGDEMGVEKIVDALRDPEGNTYDPNEDVEELRREVGRKRPRVEVSDDDTHVHNRRRRD